MKWFLVWLIITVGDSGIETRMYETQVADFETCVGAQFRLDDKLVSEGFENFTTMCEARR